MVVYKGIIILFFRLLYCCVVVYVQSKHMRRRWRLKGNEMRIVCGRFCAGDRYYRVIGLHQCSDFGGFLSLSIFAAQAVMCGARAFDSKFNLVENAIY